MIPLARLRSAPSAVNLGAIESLDDEELAELIVRALDSLLDYQTIPCLRLKMPR